MAMAKRSKALTAVLIFWLIDTVALLWLFGDILLHGDTPDATDFAGDLGMIWGALAGICGWRLISGAWQRRNKIQDGMAVDTTGLSNATFRISYC
jgi:hypothetical protein